MCSFTNCKAKYFLLIARTKLKRVFSLIIVGQYFKICENLVRGGEWRISIHSERFFLGIPFSAGYFKVGAQKDIIVNFEV